MYKAIGIGIIDAARQPRSVLAHCTPRSSYMYVANMGNAAAAKDRSIVCAATADAGLCWGLVRVQQMSPDSGRESEFGIPFGSSLYDISNRRYKRSEKPEAGGPSG